MEVDDKLLNMGILIVATLVVAKLISFLIMPRSKKRVPPAIKTWPVIGGLLRFMKGLIVMIREEYPKLGSVFTLNLFNKKITFLIGPEVSAHFFSVLKVVMKDKNLMKDEFVGIVRFEDEVRAWV